MNAADAAAAAAAGAYDGAAAQTREFRPRWRPPDARPEPPPSGGTQLNVHGVKVSFPFAAYRSQLAMMYHIVKVARDGTHALVESPTGTGKSMALLCAALAWQRHALRGNDAAFVRAMGAAAARDPDSGPQAALRSVGHAAEVGRAAAPVGPAGADGAGSDEATAPVTNGALNRDVAAGTTAPSVQDSRVRKAAADPAHGMAAAAAAGGSGADEPALDGDGSVAAAARKAPRRDGGGDEEGFVEAKKPRDATWQNSAGKGRRSGKAAREEEVPENAGLPPHLQAGRVDLDTFRAGGAGRGEDGGAGEDVGAREKTTPRIFYASRTHAQLAQVVGELRKSGYTPRMSLLASRREYCLHPVVKYRKADQNEACSETVKEASCQHFLNQEELISAMRDRVEPWDIEEMLVVGAEHRGCPYYSAVELAKDAELILCPYNYLLDAVIRKARSISVAGDIVLFDEAHNIEDHAREAASSTAELSLYSRAVEEIKELTVAGRLGRPGSQVHKSFQSLQELLASTAALGSAILQSGRMRQENNAELATFEREELVARLLSVDITLEKVLQYGCALKTIAESRDEDYDTNWRRGPGSAEDGGGEDGGDEMDAGAVFFQSRGRGGRGRRGRDLRADGADPRRRSTGRGRPGCMGVALSERLVTTLAYALKNQDSYVLALQRVVNQWESRTELSLWCLNAAVPFELLSSTARSIIVTSGTLAPLDSFAGELDVNFSVTKSLPHVVDIQRQVYTSVVAVGPGMVRMDTTYRNASNFMWQDSLGFAIVDYCKIIPGGVLIFFPSYRLLNSLVQRWQSQGTWERLEHVKGTVVCESSGRGQEFEESIAAYTVGAGEPDGAVMLGVCRGKISEGLDFKDAQARGVLIIGIPYPAARDPKLVSKRAWNDRERRDNDRQELLSGSAWYDMQAFRALNQAVGRCVRHRRDFGAIVLLDQRFCAPSVAKQLPSWVRGAIRPGAPSTHEATLQGLTTFFATVEDNLPPP